MFLGWGKKQKQLCQVERLPLLTLKLEVELKIIIILSESTFLLVSKK